MKKFKEMLKEPKPILGSWITLGVPAIAEIMAKSGFDWLAVDMEHSSITFSQAEELIRVIDLAGCRPLVRVGENNPGIIKRVMDSGAHGVIVPMVNNRQDAVKAVEAVRYPPKGKRGVGLFRAQGYGLNFEEYKKWLSSDSVVVVQIEHIQAIDNLEEILAVEGVDASIIGPYDLSASMGYPGDYERQDVKEAVKRYQEVCKAVKKPAGYHVVPCQASLVDEKMREGFLFLAFSLDTVFLGSNIHKELKSLGRD
ncbi:MAG: aldolase/citrate lyase family protein [Candidatus Omnitrophica bacterium]|nr:aldolase/citrate lyase family protein [Candidatus Omnitrophota bacterium]MDD5430364.1 aldolase/citrate lyase family protein [Candidatus Omnitrophota bacterium]